MPKTMQKRPRIDYDSVTIAKNALGITHDFFKTFEPNSRKTYELQELTTDYANQLRPSRTEYDSATNPNICKFVPIRGIRGLCGIGVLVNGRVAKPFFINKKIIMLLKREVRLYSKYKALQLKSNLLFVS